jgi:hypothetical protein
VHHSFHAFLERLKYWYNRALENMPKVVDLNFISRQGQDETPEIKKEILN